jgi:DNA helicase-2/ATP-dependent DNA helicase PcrA
MKTEFLACLNPQQQEAVCHQRGPLLVLAGAGSGKTRILTSRIVYLIEQGIPPSNILAVTFTNKAASEMKSRVRQHIDDLVNIGTFHSICLGVLRRHGAFLGLNANFSIYDDQDQLAIVKECLKEFSIDEKTLNPKAVREQISRCKDQLQLPEDLKDGYQDAADAVFLAVYQRYEEKLRKSGGLDFGDLILRAVMLLQGSPEILRYYQERYEYILVDEYQDTNYAQYLFVNLLASRSRNLMVVGDPDQSIYEWRGANIENILKFEGDFSEARVIRLEQNYRSTNNILSAANGLIIHNVIRKEKNLWSQKGEGDKVQLYRAFDERDEARYMVDQMIRLRQQGFVLKDMVGFYRTHSQSRVLEEELRRCNIPYTIVGGVKFYARKEVKDLLAYLRLICNPEDAVSLKRVINVPKRSIGPGTMARMELISREENISLFEAVRKCAQEMKPSAKLAQTLNSFFGMIVRWEDAMRVLPLSQLFEKVVEESGYLTALEQENTLESRLRMENIKELYSSIVDFEQMKRQQEGQDPTLRSYLEMISLQSQIDDWSDEDSTFTLMTLHCAKGLEFPIVFILGMEEGLLPHNNAVNSSFKEMEEERRLCYVGFTRAMEQLYLSYAVTRRIFGTARRQRPSRFLFEIPEDLLDPALQAYEGYEQSYEVSGGFEPDEDQNIEYYP